jgi:hypothetical protein
MRPPSPAPHNVPRPGFGHHSSCWAFLLTRSWDTRYLQVGVNPFPWGCRGGVVLLLPAKFRGLLGHISFNEALFRVARGVVSYLRDGFYASGSG